MIICPRCSKEFNSTQSFLTHIARKYKLSSEEIYCEINNISEVPLYKCGCGEKVVFHTFTTGYCQYRKGHASDGSNFQNEGVSEKRAQSYRDNFASGKTVREKKEKLVFIQKEFQCPLCKLSYDKLISLSVHYRKGHKKTAKDLILALNYNNIEPLCKCGCRTKTNFLDISRGFVDYVVGHSARDNNNWGNNKEALLKSQDVRREMWKNGEIISWSKGLTTETSEILYEKGKRASESMQNNPELLRHLSDRMKEMREKGIIKSPPKGPMNPLWKGGISSLHNYCHANARLYKDWKYPLLKKSNFSCLKCFSTKGLQIHHDKEKFSVIVRKVAFEKGWGESLSLQLEVNNLELNLLKEQISEAVADYHIQNNISGIVLCYGCHKLLHNNLNLRTTNKSL